jgi:hypothetical protein
LIARVQALLLGKAKLAEAFAVDLGAAKRRS